jgi:very-short-patch-repair endonuclease
MDPQTVQASLSDVLALASRQHGVVARAQLIELGMHPDAIRHRVHKGRLHSLRRGVYAVGRPQVGRYGVLMAAVLSHGPKAALSHETAAELWEIRPGRRGPIELCVPASARGCQSGTVVHRRARFGAGDVVRRHGIPVTTPVRTLVDLATRLNRDQLEGAINEADKRDLVDPEALRASLDGLARQPGVRVLREVLDRRTFTMTDTQLERLFLPIARRAGLARPETQRWLNGFRVDFYWPDLGLVVETDGLRYHRTPAEQARDRVRDQAHAAAGLTPLRFTRAQVRFEASHVCATLAAVAARLHG